MAARPPSGSMPGDGPSGRGRLVRKGPAAASLGTAALALAALVGWVAGVEVLRAGIPGSTPMVPLTAVGLLLAALSLWLQRSPHAAPAARRAGQIAGAAAAVIGLAHLLGYALGFGPDLGRLFSPVAIEVAVAPGPRRRAPWAALGVFTAGLALLLLDAGPRRGVRPTTLLGVVTGLIGLQSLIGYAYGVRILAGIVPLRSVALPTAVAFVALALGTLVARPGRGLEAVIAGDDAGSTMARRLLPAAILVPVVLGWATLVGERAGLYGSTYGTSLLALASIIVLTTMVWASADDLRRIDLHRLRAEARRMRLYARERAARGEAERRAREEAALRRAAGAITEAFTVEEVVRRIAESAIAATGADGAFVERIDIERDALEVVATAGEWAPSVGARVPLRGSPTAEAIERGRPCLLERLNAAAEALPGELARACRDCSAVFLPLLEAGEALGSLVLVHAPGRTPVRPDEVARADAFGRLAAVALRKVNLMEDLRQRREDLEKVMESRHRLMRGFSHDLKNPLGAADGQAQLLEEGIVGALMEEQLAGVRRIRSSLRSAFELIADLLELARIESGRITIERAPVDLRHLAEEIAGEYRAQATAAGLTLRLELPAEPRIVESDAHRLRQVLGNLLSNAVKYTPPGGGVAVVVGRRVAPEAPGPGEWAVIDVADTGPGIPEDQQALLFREYQRLRPATGRGAGLGLAISRQIARALGGELTFESRAGRGSIFTLWVAELRAATGARAAG